MRRLLIGIAAGLAASGAGLAWSASRGVTSGPPQQITLTASSHGPGNVTLTRIGSGFLAAWQADGPLTLRRLGGKGKPVAGAVEFDERLAAYALAYDSKRRKIMMAYSAVDPADGTVSSVMTQRLSLDGAQVGPAHELRDEGYVVGLRYDPKTDRFILATSESTATRTWRLGPSGAPEGAAHEVLDRAFSCALSERALAGQYLLACEAGGTVAARRLARSGAPRGVAIEFAAGNSPPYGLPGVSVATGPKRWLLGFSGKTRALVRTLDARGRRHGGTSFSGNSEDDDAHTLRSPQLAYSPGTKALMVVWVGEVYSRASDRGAYASVRARLVDDSSLKPIGPLSKDSTNGLGEVATLAPAASGRDAVLLRDDAEGPGYPQPYVYSLYSQHLVAHR
jgi:hypothetical protein